MTPERWKQVDGLVQAALDREAHERPSFLAEACTGDDALRGEVESQIAYQQEASKFLEEPAFKHAAELMADSQPETESMEGRTISHYSILRKLGAGGMGEVYLAQDTTLSRTAHYLRGLAYLGQRSGGQAGAEFQFILDHRGLASYSPFYPLAHLGLARAYAVSGYIEKARKAYEDFFVLWKDADADLPILIEAKKEYARLK